MRRARQTRPWGAVGGVLFPVLAVVVLLCFFSALSNLRGGQQAEGLSRLAESLRRTAVACYAMEGVYPPDVEYMEEHYGLQLDRERYIVHYDVFGSNLMPDITVLERNHETEGAT